MKNDEHLDGKIISLDFNAGFKQQCAVMGYDTLREIIESGEEKLLANPLFSYTWLHELSRYLIKNGLIQYLQPAVEKNGG
ncbi:hypothetical protein GCM10023149_28940 [Mucilaginibacter gynuensis]|uniref:Uncharacterized protein n=1 Tax=Mucilaginibacter gynuensis TaxID=1302236 RepID=A0ABP8GLS9_9SPHI